MITPITYAEKSPSQAGGSLKSLFPQRLQKVDVKKPYWAPAKIKTVCRSCGDDIEEKDNALVIPGEKGLYCWKKGCGIDLISK